MPAGDAVASIAAFIADVAPDTIVTFGPDGMTGHPDHIAVSEWVTEAWRQSSASTRLLYATISGDHATRFADLNERFNVFLGNEPPYTPPDEVALAITCEGELLERKMAAIRAHETQSAAVIAELGDRFPEWIAEEWFVEASP